MQRSEEALIIPRGMRGLAFRGASATRARCDPLEARRTRMSSAAYTPSHVPVRSGPRLQAGDILLIGGRTCRVKALLPKSKAVACEV